MKSNFDQIEFASVFFLKKYFMSSTQNNPPLPTGLMNLIQQYNLKNGQQIIEFILNFHIFFQTSFLFIILTFSIFWTIEIYSATIPLQRKTKMQAHQRMFKSVTLYVFRVIHGLKIIKLHFHSELCISLFVSTALGKYDIAQAWTGSTGQRCGPMERDRSEVVCLLPSLLAYTKH